MPSSTPSCACGQPAPNTTICQACELDLRDALQAIPALAADLDIAIARLAVFADRTHARSHTAPLPYDPRAAEARTHLRAVLWCWATDFTSTPLHGPESHTHATTAFPTYWDLPGLSVWLLRHLGVLRQHEEAGTIVAEITQAYARARAVIDRPPQRVYAGPCDCGNGELLGWPGRQLVTCDHCGSTYGIAERQEWMRTRLADHLVTAHEASLMLPNVGIHVSDGTIRMWASRRRLEARPGTVPKYRLGDIVTLALARDARVSLLAPGASVAR